MRSCGRRPRAGRSRRGAARGNARRAAIQVIAAVAQRAFSSTNCEAKVFGSCAYGLDAASSDVDLVITNWCDGELIEDRPYVAYVLLRFAQHLRAEPSVVVDRVLDRARVPVIRATIYVDDGSVPVDVSLECASHTGLAAAELGRSLWTRCRSSHPPRSPCRALLRKAGLNDAYTGGLPSYAVLLMLYYATLNGDEPRSAKKTVARSSANHRVYLQAIAAEHLDGVATPTTPHRKKSTASETTEAEELSPARRQLAFRRRCRLEEPGRSPRRSVGRSRSSCWRADPFRKAATTRDLATTLLNFFRLFADESQISCLRETAGAGWPTATRWAVCSSRIL